MKLETQREQLLKPLQHVIGVVERRQTLPVLANVLVETDGEKLTFTATDLEVELSATNHLPIDESGQVTLPARKLFDILRALPEGAAIALALDGDKLLLRCGRSRFSLSTLPASEFPISESWSSDKCLRLSQRTLKTLIERTHFAMAQQDVRYYLNGLLLEVADNSIRTVATDGHRLAFNEASIEATGYDITQIIVPRKGVQELLRLLGDDESEVALSIDANHICAVLGDIRFTSKLIDGKFPDYHRVIPREGERVVLADRLTLRNALVRAAILSNDKYRGVRLQVENWLLRVQAHNPEQEEAEEEVEVNYDGDPLEIGFNVTYMLDALGALDSELVKLSFTDANSSCLIQEPEGSARRHVIMPMRL